MTWLYLDSSRTSGCLFECPELTKTSERHKLELLLPARRPLERPLELVAEQDDVRGIVIELPYGSPPLQHAALARRALRSGRRAWFHWPGEGVVECLDPEKLRSFTLLRAVHQAYHLLSRPHSNAPSPEVVSAFPFGGPAELALRARPVALAPGAGLPSEERPLPGTGVYMRTDFWSKISSGGSYGHTCYVARELARSTEGFHCFMAHRYELLDDMGLRQSILRPADSAPGEEVLVEATRYYYEALKPTFEALGPAYIYERACLGNYAGACLSHELGIPYVVEYNGSEMTMRLSFDGSHYVNEEFYLAAEHAAFRQATLVNVISSAVRDDLVQRGVPESRILVNPNGVDTEAYAPAPPEARSALLRELGWDEDVVVVGFIATFGGWHGIDVLAAALPRIAERAPRARFLLIGDGNLKHLVDAAIAEHALEDRVHCAGRVPQEEGRRLLKAADVYVSPHSSHMVGSPFFGSPTKVFEYMSLGGGIVASDLEQIGQVLSPALRPGDFSAGAPEVGSERSVLCRPGDVGEFVEGVVALVESPDVRRALGRNARRAAIEEFSWERHVERLWRALSGDVAGASFGAEARRQRGAVEGDGTASEEPRRERRDAYKTEIRKQWNQDPAGSHYVKDVEPHTLDWFLEAERYRYGEYAPWMARTMEFDGHSGKRLLEIGAGMGTDLAQFARHGASVTDLDFADGHLQLARQSFGLRGLEADFVCGDGEELPFDSGSFDVVYANGVLHHTPNTRSVVAEIERVLRPGGRVIVMVYAERSLHYWLRLVWDRGLRNGQLYRLSMGEVMSRSVEITTNDARPLVKVYTRARLRNLFRAFGGVTIRQRQLLASELPRGLRWLPTATAGRLMGWNLVLKGRKRAR